MAEGLQALKLVLKEIIYQIPEWLEVVHLLYQDMMSYDFQALLKWRVAPLHARTGNIFENNIATPTPKGFSAIEVGRFPLDLSQLPKTINHRDVSPHKLLQCVFSFGNASLPPLTMYYGYKINQQASCQMRLRDLEQYKIIRIGHIIYFLSQPTDSLV